jgi:hypothetical protein
MQQPSPYKRWKPEFFSPRQVRNTVTALRTLLNVLIVSATAAAFVIVCWLLLLELYIVVG